MHSTAQSPQTANPSKDLTRRAFLKLGATAAAASLAGCTVPADRSGQPTAVNVSRASVSGAEAFNYILGTQSIGATYQFTDQTLMVETAQAILDLGSNVLKITMGRDYRRMVLKPSKTAYPETMQYALNQGSDARTALRIKFPGAAIEPPQYSLKRLAPARLVMASPGGGGYGDPLDRDPSLVARDVLDEVVSLAAAHEIYGVVLSADGTPDAGSTALRRDAMRRPSN